MSETKTSTLDQVIHALSLKEGIDAVFVTGSQGIGSDKPYSDIDLVVILQKNDEKIKSIYTWIGGKFADVFFFESSDLERIASAAEIDANSLDGCLVSWLQKATIFSDRSGTISRMKGDASLATKLKIIPASRYSSWQKINYNLIANTRYLESGDIESLRALEIRLLYSVVECLTGYFEARGVPWRGEKMAMKYLYEHDSDMRHAFERFTSAGDVRARFEAYRTMVGLALPESLGMKMWRIGDVVSESQRKDASDTDRSHLVEFWHKLIL